MAEADWTFCDDGLDQATVDRGATAGVTPPSGGGSYTFGMNSLAATTGAVGLFYNGANFVPAVKGGSVRGAMKRHPGAGVTGWSPFLFGCLQGPSVNDDCYMLGLSDEDPHKIVLRKGALIDGLHGSAVAPETTGVLRSSTATFALGTWLHLRMDFVVNPNGDVVLNVFRNEADVDTPIWTAIPGMAPFIDDQLGVNSGSQPLTSGRMGFGSRFAAITRRAFFDQIEVFRQT